MSIIDKLGITPGPWESNFTIIATAPEMLEALMKSIRSHLEVEDCWYSCPKSYDGCCNDGEGDECNCGADKWNDYVIQIIEKATGKTWEEIKGLLKEVGDELLLP